MSGRILHVTSTDHPSVLVRFPLLGVILEQTFGLLIVTTRSYNFFQVRRGDITEVQGSMMFSVQARGQRRVLRRVLYPQVSTYYSIRDFYVGHVTISSFQFILPSEGWDSKRLCWSIIQCLMSEDTSEL